MSVSVSVLIYKLGLAAALGKLEAVSGYEHNVFICYFKERTVKNCSLIIYTHRKIDLSYHFLKHRLTDDKATVTLKLGDIGKITS